MNSERANSASDENSRLAMLEMVFHPAAKAGIPVDTTKAMMWIFPGQKITIGRSSPEADLVIQHDPTISKAHLEIAFDGQVCNLRDLNSTNGTQVNDRRVSAAVLDDGDEISAGATRLRLLIIDKSKAEEDAAPIEATLRASDPQSASTVRQSLSVLEVAKSNAEPRLTSRSMVLTLTIEKAPFPLTDSNEISRLLCWVRPNQSVKVGRSGWESDWVINGDQQLSGKHFEVSCDGKACYVEDLGSSNGTALNGEPVTRMALRDGDFITAGQTIFKVHISGS